MKVNIRYTVNLDEVLKEMSSLYYKSLDKLDEKLDIYNHLLENKFEESNLDNIIQALTQNVQFYHDHQTKLSEILNILIGYKNIKENNITEEEINDSANRGD